jgi:hypothetical protein
MMIGFTVSCPAGHAGDVDGRCREVGRPALTIAGLPGVSPDAAAESC